MEIFEKILFLVFMIASRLVAMLLFCWQLKRRKLFWIRLICLSAISIGIEFIPVSIVNIWLHCLYNVGTFVIIVTLMWLCFKENYFTVLFCCVAGKSMMHISEYLCDIIYSAFIMPNTYVGILVHLIVYVGFYFLFARRIGSEECVRINNWKTITFALGISIITDLLVMAFTSYTIDDKAKVILYIMSVLLCFVTLCLQFGMLAESKMRREAKIINQLREKERDQYAMSQDAIRLIGIKHHDIKNMLESHSAKFSQEEIQSINEMIDNFDISFNTGNATLDTVLTEKYIACKRMNIRLESLVDGKTLNFMRDFDIYSLFLNALNNAIESADKIEDESKRIIWLKIFTRGELLFIQTQNYYTEDLVYNHNKLIITTKKDKRYHGYGLQSIKMIVENYGGTMSVNTENKIFSLGLVIPIPEKATKKE